MGKKFLTYFVALAMMFSSLWALPPLTAAASGQVCGLDGVTYDSADAAEAAGVDVSYEFACTNPTSESGLYEAKSDVHFVGMLIEIGSTDVPTTIIVRPNAGGLDRTVEVTADTVLGRRNDGYTKLSDWIPGDQIRVIGKNNENTNVVEASILVNLSIKYRHNRGINGWITVIDKDAQTITYQWMNKEHSFKYNENTRFVAAGKNPATVDDLTVGDRIRGRLVRQRTDSDSSDDLAKIVIVLRRGNHLFMKIRTFRPNATLVRMDSTIVPTTIQVRIDRTPGLRTNDVNNLIGTEGKLVTVNVTEITRIVRKYFGRTTLDELSVGDRLFIVGRVNDDDTVDAKLIKDNSIWKTSTRGYPGVVVGVDAAKSYIMVNWTPIKHVTVKRLREKLQTADNTVTAQMAGDSGNTAATTHIVKLRALAERLRARIKKVAAKKIGRFKRIIKHKKVSINRIKHAKIKMKDLITRQSPKRIRVDITDNTKIIVGTNNNATIADIQVGDKVRIRGIKHVKLPIVTAETIVVVNSLPEIEESEDTPIDDINEVVDEIVTDDTANALTINTVTDTEKEITDDSAATSTSSQ